MWQKTFVKVSFRNRKRARPARTIYKLFVADRIIPTFWTSILKKLIYEIHQKRDQKDDVFKLILELKGY